MHWRKEIEVLILPILKGSPVTILLMVLAFLGVRRVIHYATPMYQAKASIKIDHRDFGVNDFQLFDQKDNSSMTTNAIILTESEVFKSKYLLEKTFNNLDYNVRYYRVGKVKDTELYENNPFAIAGRINEEDFYGERFFLKYTGDSTFLFSLDPEFKDGGELVTASQVFDHEKTTFSLELNLDFLAKKPYALKENDLFGFEIRSSRDLAEEITGKNLFIRTLDKEVSILSLYYDDPVPAKASKFINTLVDTYIEDCQEQKDNRAGNTLSFVDAELVEAKAKLKKAESDIAKYKSKNNIVNPAQETDAATKELVELDLRLLNQEMLESELQNLFDYISSGNNLEDFAPNYEALRDPVFKDAFSKIKQYETKREELLIKYVEGADEVVAVEQKITNLKAFINETITKTLENLTRKKVEIEDKIAQVKGGIATYPELVRDLSALERNVKLSEKLYNFLVEKRAGLAVARSADMTFHRVIEYSAVPKKPSSPNKPMYYGVAIFFAMCWGIILSYILNYLFNTIKSKEQLSKVLPFPILGEIGKVTKKTRWENAFAPMYNSIEIFRHRELKSEPILLSITSTLSREGKSYSAVHLAKAFANARKKVLVIDLDLRKPVIHEMLHTSADSGFLEVLTGKEEVNSAILKTENPNLDVIPAGSIEGLAAGMLFSPGALSFLKELKSTYEIIIVDTAPIGMVSDAAGLMDVCDLNLYMVRAKFSKVRKVAAMKSALIDYKFPNFFTVLNTTKNQKFYNSYYYKKVSKTSWVERMMMPLKKMVKLG